MSSYPIFATLLTNWNVGYPLWTAPKGVYTYMGMYGGGVCLQGGLILFGNGLQLFLLRSGQKNNIDITGS